MEERPLRRVRSFVRRPGRMTDAQRRALIDLMPRFGIAYREDSLDIRAAFGRSRPVVLDIGFGDGEALLSTAANTPEVDYLGVEVHDPGVGHLLLMLERTGIENVRVIQRDVVDVLANMIRDESIDAVHLFFPDPWPKKRHHKRRLVQPPVAAEFARVLKRGGRLHIATDWSDYAEHARSVVLATGDFREVPLEKVAVDTGGLRPPTKFERRGQQLGHDVVDLLFERI